MPASWNKGPNGGFQEGIARSVARLERKKFDRVVSPIIAQAQRG